MCNDLSIVAKSILRGGGIGCMVSLEAHFDESGTHANEVTVAGYLFESSRIVDFCFEWDQILHKFNLPYFHMVDCAHGNKPFDKLEKNDRLKVQMSLMRLIKKFSINGFVANIYNDKSDAPKSYSECSEEAMNLVSKWAQETSFDGKVAYFFERGADGQKQLGSWLEKMSDREKGNLHFRGHAFVEKQGNPGVQAADLLSWQYHNFTKKRLDNNLARLDLRALLRHPHLISDRCGEAPSNQYIQSIPQSRNRIESVYYLTPLTSDDAEDLAMFSCAKDGAQFILTNLSIPTSFVLACPNCFRALFTSPLIDIVRNYCFRCWCGQISFAPNPLPPLDNYKRNEGFMLLGEKNN